MQIYVLVLPYRFAHTWPDVRPLEESELELCTLLRARWFSLSCVAVAFVRCFMIRFGRFKFLSRIFAPTKKRNGNTFQNHRYHR